MSLYNMIHGVTNATFFILPMLGKHPDEYPRFRDCFLFDQEHPEYDNHIHVYTRTGGGNRDYYREENRQMRADPNYVDDFDDSFDSTFASWVFRVPDRWRDDFEAIKRNDFASVSEAYWHELDRVFPKLKEKFAELRETGRIKPALVEPAPEPTDAEG